MKAFCIAALLAASVAVQTFGAAVSVDGSLGAEWTGVTPKNVLFNPAAPLGNFGAPTNENHVVAYDVYMRSDASFLYVGLQSLGSTGGLDFANLYFGTKGTGFGSTLGFEVFNDNAFLPGIPGNFSTIGTGIERAKTTGATSAIEFAVPWSFFDTDPLGMGYDYNGTVHLRLSQSFGYSVAGGGSYGAERFGLFAQPAVVPLPAAATSGLALLALSTLRRRR